MKCFVSKVILISALIFNIYNADAQTERVEGIRAQMDTLVTYYPVFKERVDISVGRMRLSELLRKIAELKDVNISVRDDFDCVVSCSFTSSRIDDLIIFLCREYSLDIDIFGNIVSIFRYAPDPEPEVPLVIHYTADSLISFNFKDKKLEEVTQCITSKTGVNIIVPKNVKNLMTSGNVYRASLRDALEILARENDMEVYPVNGEKRLWCLAEEDYGDALLAGKNSGKRRKGTETDTTVLVSMTSRSVVGVKEIIPDELCSDLSITVSDEMNSMILHGTSEKVCTLRNFLEMIDSKVPLVSIDIMIVETTSKFTRKIGLNAGRRTSKSETSFQIGEGIEISAGSEHISSFLGRIEGFSNINLGDVADNLYAELKLMENQGLINLESTPKLATLNGHQAVLTKGETKYYKEINTSYMGSQNPLQTSSYNWKSVDADLILTITPHVTCDSLVTLEVDLSQSEFGTSVEDTAPPEIKKRGFKSIVRVTDGDVVLLGGIDSELTSDSRNGLPGMVRVPFLRWIFGGQEKDHSNTKMNVFIRATLID